jgi:hypothetical protein
MLFRIFLAFSILLPSLAQAETLPWDKPFLATSAAMLEASKHLSAPASTPYTPPPDVDVLRYDMHVSIDADGLRTITSRYVYKLTIANDIILQSSARDIGGGYPSWWNRLMFPRKADS